jgi:cation transport ATPase
MTATEASDATRHHSSAMVDKDTNDERTYTHLLTLLSVSAAMVGVSLTAVSLVNVIESLNKWEGWVDDILAIGSLLFSIVTLLSFLGIRTRIRHNWPRFVLLLDVLFCLGIISMVISSFLLTYFVI